MENSSSPSWLAEMTAYVVNKFGFLWQYVDMRDGKTVAMVITVLVAIAIFLSLIEYRGETKGVVLRGLIVMCWISAAGFAIFGLDAWMSA